MPATISTGFIPNVETISRELFDSVAIEHEADPEIPGLNTIVFYVTARGDVAEVAARRREWHRRTQAILGDGCEQVQLAIDIQK
jgi:hypothetical protein